MQAVSNIHSLERPRAHGMIDFAPLFMRQTVETAQSGTTIFFEGDAARHVFSHRARERPHMPVPS
ncbi:hypothetical protein [Rhizobium leguminosarum]|uniref:hypothetical protein n=1 Tax=Rhizobium leguminosarum TaxID=384 RepID=UPI001FE08B34|nr:hypothetical protein [Rhizobium leguminosarum]